MVSKLDFIHLVIEPHQQAASAHYIWGEFLKVRRKKRHAKTFSPRESTTDTRRLFSHREMDKVELSSTFALCRGSLSIRDSYSRTVALFFSGRGIGYDGVVVAVARPSENVYNPTSQNA
jgi:hypothetical protein